MKEKTTKSRGKKIAVAVVLVILIAAGTVVIKNYDNIIALYKGFTTSTEDLNVDIEKNKQDTADALSSAGINISKEDFDKLNDGSLTAEQIAELIQSGLSKAENKQNESTHEKSTETDGMGAVEQENNNQETVDPDKSKNEKLDLPDDNDVTDGENENAPIVNDKPDEEKQPEQTTQEHKPQENTPKPQAPPVTTQVPEQSTDKDTSQTVQNPSVMSEDEYNKKVADLVAKMYVIKSDFLATLSDFENKIINEYKALPKEQRTTATKAKIVADNMSYIVSLEAQCDAQVDAVTSELTELMKANGKDTALVDAIKAAYVNEKELKKAYYVSLYK